MASESALKRQKHKPARVVLPPRNLRVLAEWRAPTRAELLSIIPDCSPLYRDLAGMVADCLPGTEAKYPALPPLPAGYQPNHRDIFQASSEGDLHQLQWLVERKGEDVNQHNEDQWIPLHFAAIHGFLKCVQYLLSRGANPAARTSWSYTPLMFAALGGHCDTVRYLLHHHNDIAPADPTDPPGRVCDIRNTDGWTVLHQLTNGNLELVRDLVLQYGMDPNKGGKRGDTPLHSAVLFGKLEAVRMLVEECGADPNIVNKHGQTAARLADEIGFSDAANYLRS
jgi:ankyrin repeat protein